MELNTTAEDACRAAGTQGLSNQGEFLNISHKPSISFTQLFTMLLSVNCLDVIMND